MATGGVPGRQAACPLPQNQCVCGVRTSPRKDSAATPRRLRASGAGSLGDGHEVNKHQSCINASFVSWLHQSVVVNLHRGEMVDKSIIHSLESAVIEWSHQIRGVLKKDSSEALLKGRNPTPHTELLFWNNRSAPLISHKLNIKLFRSICSRPVIVWNSLVPTGPQSWIVLKVSAGAANYSIFRTPVLSSEKCNLEPCAPFFLSYSFLHSRNTFLLSLFINPPQKKSDNSSPLCLLSTLFHSEKLVSIAILASFYTVCLKCQLH